MRVALVSRDEVFPLHGGGIGQYVTALATLLAPVAEVTIFTTDVLRERFEELRAAGDPRLPPPSVGFAFVPEPSFEEGQAWYHLMHCYSDRVLVALREFYGDHGPDLIEFGDFRGEGFVTVQAARALDPFLAATRLCARVHSSAELCELLNGYLKPDLGSRSVHELERGLLRGVDSLICAGGDILGTYQRFYGAENLAPAVRILHPFMGPTAQAEPEFGTAGRPLRFLYAGRLERRKGVFDLVRAATGLERDDFSLTLVGGDTATGPLGVSVRDQIELSVAEDPRITLCEGVERSVLFKMIVGHDVMVVPSLWECWPYVALEALHLNRPVLGTPVGGLTEMVRAGRSGWLAAGGGGANLPGAIEAVLQDRHGLERMVRSGGPAERAKELTDAVEILDAYQRLARLPLDRRVARPKRRRRDTFDAQLPLVSAIVPYHRAWRYLSDTVESLLAQTYPRLEVVLVLDGSFQCEDWKVAEVAARRPVVVVAQMNQGLGSARNFGISQSRGRYVFPLDADNIAEPTFVDRAVAVLESCPEVAYVTSWSRYIEEDGTPRVGANIGYQPLGNRARLVAEENVAGDAAAVIRRRLFDAGHRYSEELTSYEDWAFYRWLHQTGDFGVVIPERLLRYRVREDSMQAQVAQPNRARLLGELNAHIQENGFIWTSSSA